MKATLKEITPNDLFEKIQADEKFTILDVRETWELVQARIKDSRALNIPMSLIGRMHKDAFDSALRNPEEEFVVICHHGVRSANVAIWMTQNGWKNISSLAGGIDAFADQIDPSVGKY